MKRIALVVTVVLCLAVVVYSQTMPDNAIQFSKLFVGEKISDLTTSDVVTNYTEAVLNPSANATKHYSGISAYVEGTATNANNYAQVYGVESVVLQSGSGKTINFDGINTQAYQTGSGTVENLAGMATYAFSYSGKVNAAYGLYSAVNNLGTGAITNGYGAYITKPRNEGGGSFDTAYGIWIGNQTHAGGTTNDYPLWYDGGGGDCNAGAVTRLNHLGIFAHYNPCFAAYTVDSPNFERFTARFGDTGVFGVDNVAYLGVEAGGTGTKRHLQLIGGGLSFAPSLVTPASTGTRFLCISTTGVVRSSVVPCKGT